MKTKAAIRDALKDVRRESASGFHENILGALVDVLKTVRTDRASLSILSYEAVERWHEVDITSLAGLLPNVQFDFVENTKDAPFPTKKYDAVIVPLLGFNKDGYRLGHGGGWYDRFLVTQSHAIKIGVGYESTLIDFEVEPHDIRMDIVITEEKTRDFR